MDTLESKVAVVTGAASGIGLGMARTFGHEGMRVVLSDVSDEGLNKAVADLRSEGIDCIGQLADVRSVEAVEALARAAADSYGQVHVVCNNAGVGVFGRQWELTENDWALAIDVCLWGVINGVRVFVPRMLASGVQCHVVNTASMGGLLSAPFVGPYAAAKHGVVGLSKSLRVELGGTNVGVTLVCPGNVRTNVARAMREQRDSQRRGGGADLDDFLCFLESGLEDESAMDPADVGKLVAQAIKTNQFWLLPNGAPQLPLVEADFEEMRSSSASLVAE
ncbi:SDR family NAD(P)-dependent oxidoreductase [Mycobacterium intracellulare]|uniref:Short chain dehydrogenase family protein n=1 Tax=Mycobacterium intracellulare 1956 TaxID=1299331 RepID=X8CQ36_MYCIT|nr:SDR family NAD(P)-dependent oxidoreductase [Mycobacterium intracellulare]EUA25392.1 short chain dehydrogenase family protein [Mycobacterium intracellulare]EUA57365.1 short chain dehydrogenase family protein [Mycobacterium intracellulare 1956]MCA2355808.1 SDR family NAD(P)-dependent oxidoreductase [Mycobacterium intracellulare]MCA2365944.1 SDR family NAD(P)-dependent oxidoreductase [Mycobacterium intracellulare]